MAKRKRKENQTPPPSQSTRTTTRTTAHMTTRTTARTTEPVTSARITRSMTTDAARQAVFNTAELLENVLVYLPLRQLFTVQRVSHQFKAAIKESTQIQKKMFLRLGGEPKEEWIVMGSYPYWTFIDADSKQTTDGNQSRCTVAKATEATFEPVDGYTNNSFEASARLDVNTALLETMTSLIKGRRHSWDDVYLCDPPCLSARLYLLIGFGKRGVCDIYMDVTSQSGLTLGGLINGGRLSSAEFFSDDDYIGRQGLEGCQTIRECFDKLEREAGAPLKIHTACAFIDGFVIPSEDLRRQVAKRR